MLTDTMKNIVEDTRSLHRQFEEEIEPYKQDLWNYCRYVTGSPWEGEDLFQETLLKAFAMLPQIWQPLNAKAYLFRIATNRWIDECRKRKLAVEDESDKSEPDQQASQAFNIREALEVLVYHLTPKQVTTLLLMDVFQFKAAEIANMVHSTEGAIYGIVYRARKKLQTIGVYEKVHDTPEETSRHSEVVDAYLDAFNRRDVEQMLHLTSDTIHMEVSPGFQEFSKGDVEKGSMQAGIMGKKAYRKKLWGKEVIIVLAETEPGLQLHDVQFQDVADEKIVRHKSYFFCRELLTTIANTLEIPLQRNKPPVNWE
ncbi:RNA polymerase sigma factor [Alkalihalobacillus sp. TS-13]|uniref:RNA polymerase sigma factor n=1 Tax=Alkalihalobacillus sp. TS-13 TaxID=2842455 RepID=UPI001C86B1CA|nr:RNA polymerase sigma factor [Alkalihalobacillus sp. TS-13]